MENTIYNFIKDSDNKNVKCARKSSLPYLLFIILAIAVIALAISPVVVDKYTSMMLIMVAVVIVGISISMWAVMHFHHPYKYVYVPTGEVLKQKTLYLNSLDAQVFESAVPTGNFSSVARMKPEIYSEYYLNIWGVRDGAYYLCQLMKYESQQFQPATNVLELEGNNAQAVKSLVEKQ